MDEVLNLDNRRKIYGYIAKHPGTHLREMERELEMPMGLLSYHLDYMVRRGILKVEDDGYKKYYFPADLFHLKDRRTISILRQEACRKMVIFILLHGPSTFQQLQGELKVSKSTLSYHLKRLISKDILMATKRDRETLYSIEAEACIADLLIALRPSLQEDAVDRFADIWSKMSEKES